MKIDFDKTIRAAARLRGHLGLTDPETICRALDLQILRLPLGTARNSIKGFIQRSARCYTIVVNSDLSALLQDIILFHEIGHYWLGHMDASVCTFHDSGFAYSLTSALENEANSFVAEYLLDTPPACPAGNPGFQMAHAGQPQPAGQKLPLSGAERLPETD